jgi:crotonobetainyl-CoA:carnitine CoA-transferase CaiB-like acyl-CoA transferase
MRSLAIDLATPDGIALLHSVVPHADVVTDGLRPGVADKLGIGYETLRAIRPDIITMSVAPFGVRGDLAGSGGVDMVLQAMSGAMLAQGSDEAPVGNTIAIMDVTTAALSTFATTLALYHRERTGEGQRVWDSLLGTSTFLALGELTRYQGRPPAIRGGTDFKGREPLDRYYPVADGWIRVQATDPFAVCADDLKQAGLAVSSVTTEDLAAAVAPLAGEEAVAAFTAAGIPAATARRLTAVLRDPALLRGEFAHFRRADDGTTIATPGRYATFSRTQRQGPLTPPGIGEDTRDVLAMAGRSPVDVQAAIDAKIVATGGRSPVRLGHAYR